MSDFYQRVLQTRDRLNSVGKGFCLMKWLTQTLYLHMGYTHSCYHPLPHRIRISDIAQRPSGLHNTPEKKEARREMLSGQRPGECYYCWNIEDLPGDHISDRMIHSSSEYAVGELDRVAALPWDADINPHQLEVSFGNACNFKCGYCCPQASSSWLAEIKKFGDYDITTKQYSIDFLDQSDFFHPEDNNPYLDAFWQWWPELKKDLRIFRITGGEPLMNPNTMRLLERIESDPVPNLQLHCNSNLGVAPLVLQRFVDKVARLVEEQKIKSFRLYTSIDAWGKKAEYIRHGLDCAVWETNMRYYLKRMPKAVISFMCTFNVLSVANYRELLEKILEWRAEFRPSDPLGRYQRINFDVPYLKEPLHWMINILPREYLRYMDETLAFMERNARSERFPSGFDRVELEKFKRVRNYMDQNPVDPEKIRRGRRDFYAFFQEHDRRRGTSFAATFPEYAQFMSLCEQTYRSFLDESLPERAELSL